MRKPRFSGKMFEILFIQDVLISAVPPSYLIPVYSKIGGLISRHYLTCFKLLQRRRVRSVPL